MEILIEIAVVFFFFWFLWSLKGQSIWSKSYSWSGGTSIYCLFVCVSSVPTLKLSQLWFTKNFASSVSFKHSVLFVVKDSAACQAALLPKT